MGNLVIVNGKANMKGFGVSSATTIPGLFQLVLVSSIKKKKKKNHFISIGRSIRGRPKKEVK